jgi:undecaprenyl diphosphate synthase
MSSNIPQHIAIIMDGNRRWAKENNKTQEYSYKIGSNVLHNICKNLKTIGVKHLTVYAFSTENWSRDKKDISILMDLMESYLYGKEVDELISLDISINIIGDISKFSDKIQKKIREIVDNTKEKSGSYLNIALNYGARQELLMSCKETIKDVLCGNISFDNIDENFLSSKLYTNKTPDPDLLIRTGDCLRVSNFLLWQLAYAELYFSKKCGQILP